MITLPDYEFLSRGFYEVGTRQLLKMQKNLVPNGIYQSLLNAIHSFKLMSAS